MNDLKSLAQPRGEGGNWVNKKIPGCAVELNTKKIVHGLAAKYP